MISNNYQDMSYNYPLYHHGSSPTLKPTNEDNKNLILTNYNNNSPMVIHNQPPSINHYQSLTPNTNMNTQYYYQPLKLGRNNNEYTLSNENIIPPYFQRNYIESGMSVDYSLQQFNYNTVYSSFGQEKNRFLSSPSSNSLYNTQPCMNKSIKCESNHYRRSSTNTSRSSSPSFHDSFISRSPSPVNNKRYSCRLCNKRFTRPSSLTTHIYSHTGEKPFKCTVEGCGRNFSVVSNLRRHAKVHGNNPTNSTSTSTAYSF